jgi:signal transduction histidine kinase
MSIGARLTRAFVCVSLVIAAGSLITISQFAESVYQTKRILAIDKRLADVYLLEGDLTALNRQLSAIAEQRDLPGLNSATHSIRSKLSEDLRQSLASFHQSGATAPDTLVASTHSVYDELDAIERLAGVADWQAIRLRINIQLTDIIGSIKGVVDRVALGVYEDRLKAAREVEAIRRRGEIILGITAVTSLLTSLLLGVRVTKSIVHPLRRIKEAAHQIAARDFHLNLVTDSNDELADVGRDLVVAARELEISYSALQRSNNDLERFAYVVSHDLREPLRTVSSFSQLLHRKAKDVLDAGNLEYLALIIEGAARMNRLIEGILEYSRLTNSEQPGFEKLEIGSIVEAVQSSLQAAIGESGALVTCGPLPQVVGNRIQIIQVFQNLISNAIKYRRPDIALKIHISAQLQPDTWLFCIQDNGPGIDPEHRVRIFDIFQQVGDRKAGGAGIGLAVAKRIVEQHGGAIWVESSPGGGSRFFFTLPRQAS